MQKLYTFTRRSVYITLGIIGSLLRQKPPLITIFCYHSISDKAWEHSVSLAEFKKEIGYLSTKFEFITLNDVLMYLQGKKEINNASAVLTFDDGYKDILSVRKYLKEKGIKPTVFILSDPNNASRHELNNDLEFLGNKDVKKLHGDGWEIGSHTATHKDVNKLSLEQINFEIKESKNTLEKTLGFPIKYIAYPKGKYNEKILESVKNSGYKLGLTMDDNVIQRSTNPFTLSRIGINKTHSLTEFKFLSYSLNRLLRKVLK